MKPGAVPADWADCFLREHEGELIALRRHLHAHPELSGAEYETTDLIAERLDAAGIAVRKLPSGTGLVADLGSPTGRGVVGFRADIDALAMDDRKSTSYRSRIAGRAHACGHDAHTVIALGLGLAVQWAEDHGFQMDPVRLIFEPAEESVPGGAVEVIEVGGLDGVSEIYGFHCDPKIDIGQVGLRVGPLTAATDAVYLQVMGPGGHTARPELTVDVVAAAARVVAELPAWLSHELKGEGEALVVFGAIHGGDAPNVIPSCVELRGSVRIPERGVWDRMPALVDRGIKAILTGTGATVSLDYRRGIPPVVNEERCVQQVDRAARHALGADSVVSSPRSYGGDSFAWYLERVGGCYARLGVHDPRRGAERLDLHSGHFDVDERSIGHGIRVWCALLEQRMTGRA